MRNTRATFIGTQPFTKCLFFNGCLSSCANTTTNIKDLPPQQIQKNKQLLHQRKQAQKFPPIGSWQQSNSSCAKPQKALRHQPLHIPPVNKQMKKTLLPQTGVSPSLWGKRSKQNIKQNKNSPSSYVSSRRLLFFVRVFEVLGLLFGALHLTSS